MCCRLRNSFRTAGPGLCLGLFLGFGRGTFPCLSGWGSCWLGFVLEGRGILADSWARISSGSRWRLARFFGVGAVLFVSSMPRARLQAFSAAALLCSAFSAENFFASETALSVSSFQILWIYALSWLDSLALEMFCCISDCILDCSVLSCSMTFE